MLSHFFSLCESNHSLDFIYWESSLPDYLSPPAFKFVNSRHTKNTFPYFPRATLRFYFDANYKKMWVGNDIETS